MYCNVFSGKGVLKCLCWEGCNAMFMFREGCTAMFMFREGCSATEVFGFKCPKFSVNMR